MELIPGKCASAEDGNNSETSTVRPNYKSDDQIDVGALMNIMFHEDQVMNSVLDHEDSVPYDYHEVLQMQNAVHREENGIDLQNNNSQTDSEDGDDEESEADFSGSEQAQI